MQPKDYIPLSETTFFILLSLAAAPKHGYGILKEVEALSAGRVSLAAGTLYSALRRLLEDGWIEPFENGQKAGEGRERKLYRLTDLGRRIFELESQRYLGLARLIAAQNQAAQKPGGAKAGGES